MVIISVCAALAILQSSLTDSFASLILALATVAAAVLTEFAVNRLTETRTLKDGSAVVSALVLVLLLPNHINPLLAALGIVFAMVVVKQSFGGLGANWMNPALGGWLFIRLSWPGVFERALTEAPALPAGVNIPVLFFSFFGSLDRTITGFLNNTIFTLTGSELPDGYIGLLFSTAPGIVADRGLGALLVGTILIISSQTSRFWVAPLFLGVYAVLVRFFGALPGFLSEAAVENVPGLVFPGEGGDMLYGLFSGGVIAAAFLLMLEPVSGAKTGRGIAIIAVLGGVLTFLFRYRGNELYGAFFAVALLNVLTPVIRSIESRMFHESRFYTAGGLP
jgi:electron transport complex protein RnfD